MRSFFSWFWDHRIMSLLHFEIIWSQHYWSSDHGIIFLSILRSRDHGLFSFWDHRIMSFLHFGIMGSCVFFIWITRFSKIKIMRSQELAKSKSWDHKIFLILNCWIKRSWIINMILNFMIWSLISQLWSYKNLLSAPKIK